jgi:replication fork clamp-binding protein CrfC
VNRTEPLAVVDRALAAIAGYERPDLDERLRQARTRLLDDRVRVLVVGEFKQGKSMLVNGLVGAPVCPTFDDVATAVPTRVRHADKVTVTLVRDLDPGGPDPSKRRTERIEVPADELVEHVCEQGNPGNREGWSHVEVAVPRPVLAGGLELVDTPGVGGLQSVHGAATMAALPAADAVLLVSDASQEYTAPELEFLAHAASVCPNVACVITKTDLYPEWRRIIELDREHLAAAGITADVFGVSSTLRWQAVLENDAEINTESGFPELLGYLRKRVLGQADRLVRRGVVHDVLAVTDQLAGNLRSERSAQQNPAEAQQLLRTLTAAQERATALKERSARWQQTLNDGVADLNADIDYDLRDRMREISRMAEEELLSGGDPSKVWDQFAAWVQQEVAAAAAANFLWATQRARWLAHQVAEHFAGDRDQLLPALRNDPSDALRSVRPMAAPEGGPTGLGTKALTAMRGGYGGLLMFGMVGTFIGFASLINPLGIGAAIMMGGKSIGDERKRMITKRQNEAKAAVRRYVDDVTFQVAKDSRDRLRTAQRDLRDHFTAQAEQMKRSLQESQQAAERAVKASTGERQARLTEITTALEQLEAVRRQARALLPQPQPATPPATPPAGRPEAVRAG